MTRPPRRRGLAVPVAAIGALAFLAVMTFSGALPRQRQLVQFEATGLLRELPADLQRVEVTRGERRIVLRRADGGWEAATEAGRDAPAKGTPAAARPLPQPLAERIDMAVQMLHTAGPIGRLDTHDIGTAAPAEFGFDAGSLALAVVLADGARSGATSTFRVRFGSRNPEDTAQYLRVEGSDGLYLMSRFVGAQWEAVATEVLQ